MDKYNLELLLNGREPSKYLNYLAETRKLDPELAALINIPQDVNHHPEGDAFIHTCMVLNYAAELSTRKVLDTFDNAVLRLAALLHDVGKATTTVVHEDGRITAYGHPEAGLTLASDFMVRSKVSTVVIEHVLPLIQHHMAYVGYYTPDITTRAIKRLIKNLQPTNMQMLMYVIESDMSGRGGKYYRQGLPARAYEMLMISEHLDSMYRPDPILSGDDIMKLTGLTPSKALGQVKQVLYDAQLAGKFSTKQGAVEFLRNNIEIRIH